MMGLSAKLTLIIFTILFSTGWFQRKIPIKPKILLLFIIMYWLFSMIDIPLTNGVHLNIGGFVVPGILYFFLWVRNDQNRVYVFTSTMLIGTIYFILKVFFRGDPILLVFEESFQISFILSVIVFLVAMNLVDGISLFMGGTLMGEIFFFFYNRKILGFQFIFGDQNLQDTLLYGVLFIWILGIVMSPLKGLFEKKKFHLWRKKRVNGK